jgi:hypothetical protein
LQNKNINAVCIDKSQFKAAIDNLCSQALQSKPIFCISTAILLDLIEYSLRVRFNQENKIIIAGVEFTLKNFIIFISSLKSFLLLTALFFLIFGTKAWA